MPDSITERVLRLELFLCLENVIQASNADLLARSEKVRRRRRLIMAPSPRINVTHKPEVEVPTRKPCAR